MDIGLLRAVSSPDELAAVLAHEMSHVVHRDPLSFLAARLGIAALMSILGTRSGAAVVQNAIGELVSARYGRAAEDQADRFAVDLLAAAGLDPEAFAGPLADAGRGGAHAVPDEVPGSALPDRRTGLPRARPGSSREGRAAAAAGRGLAGLAPGAARD